MIPTLSETRRILRNKPPAPKHRVAHGNGFFYTSRLGYICYHSGRRFTIGHAICSVKQLTEPDAVYTAAAVVIATMHALGEPTTASLLDLERALINADA